MAECAKGAMGGARPMQDGYQGEVEISTSSAKRAADMLDCETLIASSYPGWGRRSTDREALLYCFIR